MDERQISFRFDGSAYVVDYEAYELGRILLPDGCLLEPNSWTNSNPPEPIGLHEVSHEFKELEIVEIANKLEAVIAEEVVSPPI